MPAFIEIDEPRRLRLKRHSHQQNVDSMAVVPISCEKLRAFLEQAEGKENVCGIVLLDCRSFLAYNEGHIIGANNVHCPAILRRRSGGRLPLRTVVPETITRDRLMEGASAVLYGDEPLIACVARCLTAEVGPRVIYHLEGGIHHFRLLYPHLCTSDVATSVMCSPPRNHLSAPPATGDNQVEPVEILPHLYLGNASHASHKDTLQRLGICALLNVSHTCPNLFEESFHYKCIPVEDSASEDIGRWFNEAIDFIESVKQKNGKVLVHCEAGISRSATICMAYLMATKRLRMEDAYEYVKTRRKIVSPNFHFMGQLLSFEATVFSSKCCPSSPRSPLLAITPEAHTTFEFPHFDYP